jgi:hypothetical protein
MYEFVRAIVHPQAKGVAGSGSVAGAAFGRDWLVVSAERSASRWPREEWASESAARLAAALEWAAESARACGSL